MSDISGGLSSTSPSFSGCQKKKVVQKVNVTQCVMQTSTCDYIHVCLMYYE